MIDVFFKHKLLVGRVLSSSKSFYRKKYSNNFVVFNANIITEEDSKIWHGDLDLTLDEEVLKSIAKDIGKTLYVLREYDCRFDNKNNFISSLIQKAIWSSGKGDLRDNG